MHNIIKNLYKKQKGQAMIEYGLIVSFISIAVLAAIFLLGGKDGGGTCEKNDTNLAISFVDHTYDKQGDSGLYSLYRSVTCRLGGWSEKVVFKDKYESQEEAKRVGFRFPSEIDSAISGYEGSVKDILIPSSVWLTFASGAKSNKEINQIKEKAFQNQGLTSVILPDTLEQIHQNSFENNNLKNITVPKNVSVINQNAFRSNKLTNVKLNDGVKLEIHNFAFANNQLRTIEITGNVTSIGYGAFDSNVDLKEITINNRSEPLKFKVDGNGPSEGWTTGTYKLENKKWVKSN